MAKNKDNREKNSKNKKAQEKITSMVDATTSNKIENQNQTYNSKKEGLGPNGKR
jgi:hypothetical protein